MSDDVFIKKIFGDFDFEEALENAPFIMFFVALIFGIICSIRSVVRFILCLI